MSNAITTELAVQMRGVESAVQGMNAIAVSSRKMATEVDASGGHAIKAIAKFSGHMAHAGRYEFMAVTGLAQALESASGGWKSFSSTIGQTALFAGAAIGFNAVTDAAQALSAEIDKLNESAGKKPEGFLGNVITGWKGLLGLTEADKDTPITEAQIKDKSKARGLQSEEAWKDLQEPSLKDKFRSWYAQQEKKPTAAEAKEKYSELQREQAEKNRRDKTADERAAAYEKIMRQAEKEGVLGETATAAQRVKAALLKGGDALGLMKDWSNLPEVYEREQWQDEKAKKTRTAREKEWESITKNMADDLERGDRMREAKRQQLQGALGQSWFADYQRGSQHADLITKGSYDAARMEQDTGKEQRDLQRDSLEQLRRIYEVLAKGAGTGPSVFAFGGTS